MKINILNCFGGHEVGCYAAKEAGFEIGKYYSSEIDKFAMTVANYNHPEVIQLGDVTRWREWKIDWSKIDLLTAGSPCQGFSFAGKQLAFDDPRSMLFFVFAEIVEHCRKANPRVMIMLENVKMKKEFSDVITKILGIEPIMINSALMGAQNRVRNYWCSWPTWQPKDEKIFLKDIVHEYSKVDREKSLALMANYHKKTAKDYFEKPYGQVAFEELAEYIVPFDKTLQILDKEVERGKVGFFRQDSQTNRAAKMGQYLFGVTKKNSQGDRVYTEEEKSPTLNASSGGTAGKGNFLFGCITPDRVNKRQNGQRFNGGTKFYTLTAQDQHGILIEGYIRKLTPIECERLQNLPDGYTSAGGAISNSQRYRMLGNGWDAKAIIHLYKCLQTFWGYDLA